MIRDITGDQRASADHALLSDAYPRQHRHICAKPGVVPNSNGFRLLPALAAHLVVSDRVAHGNQGAVWADHDVIAKRDGSLGQNGGVEIDKDELAAARLQPNSILTGA